METRAQSPRISDLSPGLTTERRGRRTAPERDEFEVALRLGPDGIEETIPLTCEILLNPCFEIKVPQSPPHSKKLLSLYARLSAFLKDRFRVYSDVILDWPHVRKVSPDVSVFENLRDRKPGEEVPLSIDMAAESCRVRAVFEVVSRGRLERWKDEVKNPPFFARRGVDDLVLLYLPELRRPQDPPIRVFSNPTAAGYTEQAPAPDGFFLLRSIGVRIGTEKTSDGGENIVLVDAVTGERLPDIEEATARAEQEAVGRRETEQEKQEEAEARRAAEKQNREMAAEIERLQAQLRQATGGEGP